MIIISQSYHKPGVASILNDLSFRSNFQGLHYGGMWALDSPAVGLAPRRGILSVSAAEPRSKGKHFAQGIGVGGKWRSTGEGSPVRNAALPWE